MNTKEEFLKDYEKQNINAVKSIKVLFQKIAPYETKYEKDCSEFTINEIINFYKSLCSTSFYTMKNTNGFLKAYATYCIKNNLVKDGQNHYDEITDELLNNCLNYVLCNSKIISRKELEHLLYNNETWLKNPVDKFIIYALFEGIGGKEFCEIVNMRIEDFRVHEDQEYKYSVKLCTGREIMVDDRLFYLAEESAETNIYYAYEQEREYNFTSDPGKIVKQMYNSTSTNMNPKAIANKLLRLRKFLNCAAISSAALKESGRIDMIKKLHEEEPDKSYWQICCDHKDELSYKYGQLNSFKTYLLRYEEFFEP